MLRSAKADLASGSTDTIDGEDDKDECIIESSDKVSDIKPISTKIKKVIPRMRKKKYTASFIIENETSCHFQIRCVILVRLRIRARLVAVMY